jgi:hypothetical protein
MRGAFTVYGVFNRIKSALAAGIPEDEQNGKTEDGKTYGGKNRQ